MKFAHCANCQWTVKELHGKWTFLVQKKRQFEILWPLYDNINLAGDPNQIPRIAAFFDTKNRSPYVVRNLLLSLIVSIT